jgi:CHASE2 domain-containing sensor protein
MAEPDRNLHREVGSNPTELLREQVILLREIHQSLREVEAQQAETGYVEVVDVGMRFGSMVAFMLKWAIASIPAIIILVVLGIVAWAVIGALGLALLR